MDPRGLFFTIDKANHITWYTIDWPITIALFISIVIIAFCAMAIKTWFNPYQFISIIKDTKELKRLDTETAHDVKHSGFITKTLFRIFSKGSERYF